MMTKVRVFGAVPGVGKQAILNLRQIKPRNWTEIKDFCCKKWDAKISASYCLTKCRFNDALMTDLQMLKFFKDIGRERPIFTVDVTKGLMQLKLITISCNTRVEVSIFIIVMLLVYRHFKVYYLYQYGIACQYFFEHLGFHSID